MSHDRLCRPVGPVEIKDLRFKVLFIPQRGTSLVPAARTDQIFDFDSGSWTIPGPDDWTPAGGDDAALKWNQEGNFEEKCLLRQLLAVSSMELHWGGGACLFCEAAQWCQNRPDPDLLCCGLIEPTGPADFLFSSRPMNRVAFYRRFCHDVSRQETVCWAAVTHLMMSSHCLTTL